MSVTLSLATLLALQPIASGETSSACASSFEPTDNSAAEGKTIRIFASDRRPLVMVSLDGAPSLPFTLDTGSSGNLVSIQVAEEAKLPDNGPSPSVDGSGNPVPGFDTCLNAMTIGGVPVADRRATAFPWDRDNEEGIISPMLFSGSLVKLDGPGLRLDIMARDQNPDALGTARDWAGPVGDAHPMVDLDLGGVKVEARLDSGSDTDILLPSALMDELALDSEPVEAGFVRTAAGATIPIYSARVRGMSRIGPLSRENFEVLFLDQATPLVGWPLMKHLVFYMDPEQRVSYFPPTEGGNDLGTGAARSGYANASDASIEFHEVSSFPIAFVTLPSGTVTPFRLSSVGRQHEVDARFTNAFAAEERTLERARLGPLPLRGSFEFTDNQSMNLEGVVSLQAVGGAFLWDGPARQVSRAQSIEGGAAGARPFLQLGEDVFPSIEVAIGNASATAVIDVSSNNSVILPLSAMEQMRLAAPPEITGEVASDEQVLPYYSGEPLEPLRIGGQEIPIDSIGFADLDYPVVGLEVARHLRLWIDYDAGLVLQEESQ